MSRGGWRSLLGMILIPWACTNVVQLEPQPGSADANVPRDAGAGDGGAPRSDAGSPPTLPTAADLRAVVDPLPRPRRAGTPAHTEGALAWAERLVDLAPEVQRTAMPRLTWSAEPTQITARANDATRRLTAWPSEASGSAALLNATVADLDQNEAATGRVALVNARFDDSLRLRVANHPNVSSLAFESLFDVYWTSARAGAQGLLLVLPEDAPPGAPTFPSVPEAGSRLPAAFITAEDGAWLRAAGPSLRLDWSASTTTATRSVSRVVARLPGPDAAPTVALIATLESPGTGREFDAGLAAAWGVLSALASVPTEDRPVNLLLIHPGVHLQGLGDGVADFIDEEALGEAADIDVFVELFAPSGQSDLQRPGPRVAWRPAENTLDPWLEQWPDRAQTLSLREGIPPSDTRGVERRLVAAPRVVISADYDHRYFAGPSGDVLLDDDVAELVANLVTWLEASPSFAPAEPAPVTGTKTSTTFFVPHRPAWPGRSPASGRLAFTFVEPDGPVRAVMLGVAGVDLPAEAQFHRGATPRSWLEHLAETGIAAYALDVSGSARSTRPASFEDPENWQSADGTTDPSASDTFQLHDTASVLSDIEAALAELERRHPGVPVHLAGVGLMGGFVLVAAEAQPERVASVTAFGTPGLFIFPAEPPPLPAPGRPAVRLERSDLLARWSPMVRRLEQVDRATFERAWAALMSSAPGGGPVLRPSVTAWGLTPERVGRVDRPVLLAYGTHDFEAPDFLVRALYDALDSAPRRWMVEVERVSHFAFWESIRTRLFELHRRWILEAEQVGRDDGVGRFDGVSFVWSP